MRSLLTVLVTCGVINQSVILHLVDGDNIVCFLPSLKLKIWFSILLIVNYLMLKSNWKAKTFSLQNNNNFI